MLVSFRQTYSNDRKILYDILQRDNHIRDLYNLCDVNIQSFHNCSRETIDYYKSRSSVKNSLYTEYRDITYRDTLRHLIGKLKEIGCTHFLWTQDDTFSREDFNYENLINYVKDHSQDFMLSLSIDMESLLLDPSLYSYEDLEEFRVYHLNMKDYRKAIDYYTKGDFPDPAGYMNDTPYFATMDTVERIYDEMFFNNDWGNDVWGSEGYTMMRFIDSDMNRYVMDKKCLTNYNIIGRFDRHKDYYTDLLKKRDLI